MVDLSGGGPEAPLEHGFNNRIFIIPAIIITLVVGFSIYKLVTSLRDKERRKEEKKKFKMQKKKK